MVARFCLVVALVFSLVGADANAAGPGALSTPLADPFPSTYAPPAARTTLIRNATILTAVGPTIRGGSILLQKGTRQDLLTERYRTLPPAKKSR
jgi:hypothetical protein